MKKPLILSLPSFIPFQILYKRHLTQLTKLALIFLGSLPLQTNAEHISKIPLDLQLKAAQYLEDVRNTEVAPTWKEDARLALNVFPLYRPDVEGVAYYEFRVKPKGFITLSTGPHDFPIPHWNFQGVSPVQELMRIARKAGKQVQKFYKLDTFSYAAEDSDGHLIATTQNGLPPKIRMNMNWLGLMGLDELNEKQLPSNGTYYSPSESEDTLVISEYIQDNSNISQDSPEILVETSEWDSWTDLKSEYANTYAVLKKPLHVNSDEEWELESLLTQYGETLYQDDVRFLATLLKKSEPRFELKG